MIDAGTVLELPDAAALEGAADSMTAFGKSVSERVEAVSTAWQRLSAPEVYEAPEQQLVLDAMKSPVTIAAMVTQNADWAAKALQTYASTVSGLEAKRTALLSDIADANTAERTAKQAAESAPSGEPTPTPTPGSDPSTSTTHVRSLVDDFNALVEQADQDCADALGKLAKYSGSQVKAVLDAVSGDGAAGIGVGAGMSTTEEALARWRRLILVPESSVDVRLTIPEPDEFIGGVAHWERPSGFMAPTPPPAPEFRMSGPTSSHNLLTSDPKASPGAIPEWAKAGGKALGIAGAGITLYAAGNEQWTKDQKAHPEWDTSQRIESAAENMVFEGGSSILFGTLGAYVGGTVGAALGTAGGAAVGSVVPVAGTVSVGAVGGVVGAIAGGAFMGYAMGDFGADFGSSIKEDYYDGSDAQKAVRGAWSDASDWVEGTWNKVFG